MLIFEIAEKINYSITTLFINMAKLFDHQYRKVNAGRNTTGGSSVSVVIPKPMIEALGLGKGSYVKVSMKDNQIIIEKAD